MTIAETEWPSKSREFSNEMLDSTRWNDFAWRPGDVIVASWGKSGTTWVQQIVAQLIFDGQEADVSVISPWLEFPVYPKDEVLAGLEAQTHRRFIKTHLPVEALGLGPDVRYLYVARDGRDVAFSMYPFMAGFEHLPAIGPDGRPNPRPKIETDPRTFFRGWVAGEIEILSPFFPNVRGWWEARTLPNVLLVHYNRLKADMPGEIARIAAFLGIEPSPAAWPAILDHCGFDYMKRNAEAVGPIGARNLAGGSSAFFHKGTNGRWRDVLTAEDVEAYERAVAANLDPDCARWLASGEI
jgi:aryl sulfotransferase